MKVVFLYTLVTNSILSVVRALSLNYKAQILFFYEDKKGNKPFIIEHVENVIFLPLSHFTSNQIKRRVIEFAPDIIYVTAWQEMKYFQVCFAARIKKIPVIAGFDDNWRGLFRQYFASIFVRLISPLFFSHAMVSGPRQYHYALRFGFAEKKIIYYLFSADVDKFNLKKQLQISEKHTVEKYFLFVGRYSSVKGIDILARGFKEYQEKLDGKFKLYCFGNGIQKNLLQNIENIYVFEYADFLEIRKFAAGAVALVLPSYYDPSPLIVHEMTCIGVPLILSDAVGNRLMFLINGFNGYTFERSNYSDLASKFKKMELLDENTIETMRANSKRLSLQHNPDFVAASLVSVLE